MYNIERFYFQFQSIVALLIIVIAISYCYSSYIGGLFKSYRTTLTTSMRSAPTIIEPWRRSRRRLTVVWRCVDAHVMLFAQTVAHVVRRAPRPAHRRARMPHARTNRYGEVSGARGSQRVGSGSRIDTTNKNKASKHKTMMQCVSKAG